ncbi:DUF2971 domain-containing protein [Gimesia benthica]|uniref:DUF2971 domain-containing protein n=1 Tax=Gimesia benthica TaxID=2608982 RepID=A0A6I6AHQ1_9PLAN|nr:DUF2971 domain-containing protein [Gimesia benthica]QGQ25616.1 DUF2971 domain-containing protein [Gimesia benthica]
MAFPPDISVEFRDLDCDEYVYHYTSRDTALEHILTGASIRLGLLRNTNDPRENRTWSFGISATNPPDPPKSNPECQEWLGETRQTLERAQEIIQEKCKLFCVTMDDPSYSAFADGLTDAKRGFGHSRMWAQYGDSHKGICLIFRKVNLDEAINNAFATTHTIYKGPVEYSDNVGQQLMAYALRQEDIDHHGVENCLVTQRERYHKTFFFSKALDWQQEFEYRWIAIGGMNEPEFVPITSAIAGVVVGVDFPDVYLPSLLKLCEALEIPAARIGWKNGIPRLKHRYI